MVGSAPVTINADGLIVKPEEVEETPVPAGHKAPVVPKRTPGIVVAFQKQGSSKVQKLYYFSTNVEDYTIKMNKPFMAFLPRMQPIDSMFKAASYLTHRDQFSIIRSKTLELSQAIIEDDSGIPYRFFDHDKWDITLFGGYVIPIPIFKNRLQPDLKAAYTSGVPVKNLDFGIGYSYPKMPSNLLLAKKKEFDKK